MDFVRVGASSECWPWLGRINGNGYGEFGRYQKAHRAVYEHLVGPIGSDDLHHRCQTKACCNPSHLERISRSEHGTLTNLTVWGTDPHRCRHGHMDDFYTDHSGRRRCRTCERLRQVGKPKKRRPTLDHRSTHTPEGQANPNGAQEST